MPVKITYLFISFKHILKNEKHICFSTKTEGKPVNSSAKMQLHKENSQSQIHQQMLKSKEIAK